MAEHDDYDSTNTKEDAVDVRQMFLDLLTGHLAMVHHVVAAPGGRRPVQGPLAGRHAS